MTQPARVSIESRRTSVPWAPAWALPVVLVAAELRLSLEGLLCQARAPSEARSLASLTKWLGVRASRLSGCWAWLW